MASLGVLLLIASGTHRTSGAAEAIPLRLPAAVILRANQPDDDPCVEDEDVRLPAGRHRILARTAGGRMRPRITRLNGELLSARYGGERVIEFSYAAEPGVIVIFDRTPGTIEVDGMPLHGPPADWRLLPGGTHQVRATFE